MYPLVSHQPVYNSTNWPGGYQAHLPVSSSASTFTTARSLDWGNDHSPRVCANKPAEKVAEHIAGESIAEEEEEEEEDNDDDDDDDVDDDGHDGCSSDESGPKGTELYSDASRSKQLPRNRTTFSNEQLNALEQGK